MGQYNQLKLGEGFNFFFFTSYADTIYMRINSHLLNINSVIFMTKFMLCESSPQAISLPPESPPPLPAQATPTPSASSTDFPFLDGSYKGVPRHDVFGGCLLPLNVCLRFQ